MMCNFRLDIWNSRFGFLKGRTKEWTAEDLSTHRFPIILGSWEFMTTCWPSVKPTIRFVFLVLSRVCRHARAYYFFWTSNLFIFNLFQVHNEHFHLIGFACCVTSYRIHLPGLRRNCHGTLKRKASLEASFRFPCHLILPSEVFTTNHTIITPPIWPCLAFGMWARLSKMEG